LRRRPPLECAILIALFSGGTCHAVRENRGIEGERLVFNHHFLQAIHFPPARRGKPRRLKRRQATALQAVSRRGRSPCLALLVLPASAGPRRYGRVWKCPSIGTLSATIFQALDLHSAVEGQESRQTLGIAEDDDFKHSAAGWKQYIVPHFVAFLVTHLIAYT
jgi:hypothetical protein